MNSIVTGASSGIGLAIYRHLQAKSDRVFGLSRRGPIKMDLRFPTVLGELAHFTEGDPIHVVVLNHGVLSFQEEYDEGLLYDVNFKSYWNFLLEARHIVQPGGCIILNASVSGVMGDKDCPLYAALKAGIINLTKTYAKILMKDKIRVNCFSCGFFKTNLVEGDTPQELVDTIPMGREADPEEILPVIDALIDCKYITGQNIIVDGGLSL